MGQVPIIDHISAPSKKVLHDLFFHVLDNPELLESLLVADQLVLDLVSSLLLVEVHDDRHLISIIVEVNESIIEEEPGVALLAVAVVDLFASWDVVTSLNNKPLSLVAVVPGGLPRSLVIEHVGVWNEAVGLYAVDIDTEDPTGHDHPSFLILSQCELLVVWHLLANQLVVDPDVLYFFVYLVEEWATNEELLLLVGEEDWEVAKALRKNVNVLIELACFLSSFLHKICAEERVLRRNKPLP